MDIPTPAELVALREQEQREAVMQYLARCLKALREQFDGRNEVAIGTSGAPEYAVEGALAALRAAGWACRVAEEWPGQKRGKGNKAKTLLVGPARVEQEEAA